MFGAAGSSASAVIATEPGMHPESSSEALSLLSIVDSLSVAGLHGDSSDVVKALKSKIEEIKEKRPRGNLLFWPVQRGDGQQVPIIRLLEKACASDDAGLFDCLKDAMPEVYTVNTCNSFGGCITKLKQCAAAGNSDAVARHLCSITAKINTKFSLFENTEEIAERLLEKVGHLDDMPELYESLLEYIEDCRQEGDVLCQMIEIIERSYGDKMPIDLVECSRSFKRLVAYLLTRASCLPDRELTSECAFNLCLYEDNPQYIDTMEELAESSKLLRIYCSIATQGIVTSILEALAFVDPAFESCIDMLKLQAGDGFSYGNLFFDSEAGALIRRECTSDEDAQKCGESMKKAIELFSPEFKEFINTKLDFMREEAGAQVEGSQVHGASGGAASSSSASVSTGSGASSSSSTSAASSSSSVFATASSDKAAS